MDFFIQAVLPGLSALLGGYVATRFALARLKRQRAFDRRLRWAERAHQTVLAALYDLRDAAFEAERNPSAVADASLDTLVSRHLRTLRNLRTRGILYASPRLHDDILDLIREHNAAFSAIRTSGAKGRELILKMDRSLEDSLLNAAYAISREVRDHLELEPILSHAGVVAPDLSPHNEREKLTDPSSRSLPT